MRVFLAPPEDLRRQWKVERDCSRRGYTTDQVLEELDRREADSAAFIRPQQRCADIVVSLPAGAAATRGTSTPRSCCATGSSTPTSTPFVGDGAARIALDRRATASARVHPRRHRPGYAAEIEEAIWERMHFASHLRSDRLGEFTIGTQLHRSESLALVQLLVLYHLVTARASVALGGDGLAA